MIIRILTLCVHSVFFFFRKSCTVMLYPWKALALQQEAAYLAWDMIRNLSRIILRCSQHKEKPNLIWSRLRSRTAWWECVVCSALLQLQQQQSNLERSVAIALTHFGEHPLIVSAAVAARFWNKLNSFFLFVRLSVFGFCLFSVLVFFFLLLLFRPDLVGN